MAYMRGEHYVYGDGDELHWYAGNNGAVHIPKDVMDEFVVMRIAQMTNEEIGEASLRAYDKHYGNFGFDGLAKMLDLPTVTDHLKGVVAELGQEK